MAIIWLSRISITKFECKNCSVRVRCLSLKGILNLQMIETQMAVKAQQVTELKSQADYLKKMDPEKEDEIIVKKSYVEERFVCLPIYFKMRY